MQSMMPFRVRRAQRHELQPFLVAEPPTPLSQVKYLASNRPATGSDDRFPRRAEPAANGDIRYLIRLDPGVQPKEDARARAAARAATRPGCSCSCCATSDWRPGSYPAT